ncbi:MAG: recombinase family protein [Lachnospiraceae bacterium]|nr:recombinase family protein [Lachnospiraceae bacterium]
MIYGYCRISTAKQSIERQIRNIIAEYPSAKIIQEVFTGTKIQGREKFEKLIKGLNEGDTVVFDSVSRMSRDAEEGIETYFELYERGVNLVFLKEHYIDTSLYAENLKDKIELTGADEDEIFKGLNNYFRKLAAKQIRIAFDQAEKEVEDLRQRTREGLVTAKNNGKQVGAVAGKKLVTKKSLESKKKMQKLAKDFGGQNTDEQVMAILGIARNTYYKYKREIIDEIIEKRGDK